MASDESSTEEGSSVPLDPVKIRARLHHHLRTCSAAVKRARAFEVQKTIKKLKAATEVERQNLESHLQALKAAQHGRIAAIAIKNKLVKAKLLPKSITGIEDEHDQQYPLADHIQELDFSLGLTDPASEQDTEGERAKAKLLSNKIVSEEVANVVKEISALLRGEEPAKQGKATRKVEHLPQIESSGIKKDLNRKSKVELEDADQRALAAGSVSPAEVDISLESSSDDEQQIQSRKSSLPNVRKPHFTISNGKRQKDSDEEELFERPAKQQRNDEQYSGSEDDASEDEETGHSLPALTTGFVGGRGFNLGRDSEDEWSDGDAELESIDEEVDGTGNKREARKNRMGQRARRAIWEKKFGKGANHLKLLEKEIRERRPMQRRRDQNVPLSRDAGWSGPLRKEPGPVIESRPTAPKPIAPKTAAEMHPSWIAKQKEKERAEAAARERGTAKKIVFD